MSWDFFGGGLQNLWTREPELLSPLIQRVVDLQKMHLYEFVGDYTDLKPYLSHTEVVSNLIGLMTGADNVEDLFYKPYATHSELLYGPSWIPQYFITISALALEYYHTNYHIELGHMNAYEEISGFAPSVGASRTLFLYSLGNLVSELTTKYFFCRQWKTNLPDEFYAMVKEVDIQYIRNQEMLPMLDLACRTPVALPFDWDLDTVGKQIEYKTSNPFVNDYVMVTTAPLIEQTEAQRTRNRHDLFYKPQSFDNVRYFIKQGYKICLDPWLDKYDEIIVDKNLFTKDPEGADVIIHTTPDDHVIECHKTMLNKGIWPDQLVYANLSMVTLGLVYALQGIPLKNQNFEVVFSPEFKRNEYEICDNILT